MTYGNLFLRLSGLIKNKSVRPLAPSTIIVNKTAGGGRVQTDLQGKRKWLVSQKIKVNN